MMLLVLLAFLSGTLSGRGMAATYIVFMFLGILLLSEIIKNTTFADGVDRKPLNASPLSRMSPSPRVLKILIVISFGLLGYGIWSAQDGPLLPSITGIAVNICMTTAFILALRKSKRNSEG
jgi:hypothetical protein